MHDNFGSRDYNTGHVHEHQMHDNPCDMHDIPRENTPGNMHANHGNVS